MAYDLHVHSTASDGILSPQELVCQAVDIGLKGISITDHDTVDGLETARKFITSNNINIDFIPGIELNTEIDACEVHILGYFINYENRDLRNRLKEIKAQRAERAAKMVEKLRNIDIAISYEEVKEMARGDLVGRPHIAQVLKNKGIVQNIEEAFDLYIAKGKPAYVPRYKFLPQEAISLIESTGGIPVLAHPGLIEEPSIIKKVIGMGIKGLEIYYPQHTHSQIIEFHNLAERYQLLVTGGSDFHGLGSTESRSTMGVAGLENIDSLLLYIESILKRNIVE